MYQCQAVPTQRKEMVGQVDHVTCTRHYLPKATMVGHVDHVINARHYLPQARMVGQVDHVTKPGITCPKPEW